MLKQIPDIKREIRDLEKGIDVTRRRIDTLKRNEVCDTVTGSRADLTIGPIQVRGHPEREYGKRLRELQKKKELMEKKKTELSKMESDAEEYIQTISQSSLRRLLRYRYMDGLSWQQVATRMGHKYSAESCRKRVERFMSDESRTMG